MPASDHRAYVAIDLETTGFDPLSDRIIEVGAVRFDRRGNAEHFRSFVQPGRPIPAVVQTLTGIADYDVADAPFQLDVLAQLRQFAGGRDVVGHNVQFDLTFLASSGLELGGPAYDTFDLASALLPSATRLNLSALAVALGIEMPIAHRALADADATHRIFLRLLDRLEALPRGVLLDLLTIAEQAEWSLQPLIVDALTSTSPFAGVPAFEAATSALVLSPPAPLPAPLSPREELRTVEVDDLLALLQSATLRTGSAAGIRAARGTAGDGTGCRAEHRHRRTPRRGGRDRHREVAGVSLPVAAVRAAQR